MAWGARRTSRPTLFAATPALFPRQARQPLPQLIQIVLLSLFRAAYQQTQSAHFIAQPFQLGPIVAPPALFGVAPLFDQNIESSGNTFQGVALPFQQTQGRRRGVAVRLAVHGQIFRQFTPAEASGNGALSG